MSSQVRDRVSRLEVRAPGIKPRPFGLTNGEIIVAVAVLLFFVLVVTYYFASLKPDLEQLRVLQAQASEQQIQILKSQTQTGGEGQSAPDTTRDALQTLEEFETRHLKPLAQGRIAIIDEINSLSKKSNVNLISGVDMKLDRPGQQEKKKESSRKQIEQMLDVYPKLSVRFTVAGEYQNLREFINALDHSGQFMVIHSVSLTSIQERASSSGGGRRVSSQASGLSLSIDLLAYFQP